MLCAGVVCWNMLCSLLCYSTESACSMYQWAERESTSVQSTPRYEDVSNILKLKKYQLERGGAEAQANVGMHIARIRSSKNYCPCKSAWCKGSQQWAQLLSFSSCFYKQSSGLQQPL